MKLHGLSLRNLYRGLDDPGNHPLKDAQAKLDNAIRLAYGLPVNKKPLEFLLELNEELVASEMVGNKIVGPGIPPIVKNPQELISIDCIKMP